VAGCASILLCPCRVPRGCSSLLGSRASRSPPPPAKPQPQLQQLPPHLQQAPAAESRAPWRPRCRAGARRLRAHSLTCIPPASRRPRSLRLPGLGRAWGEDAGSEGCDRVGTACGGSEGGAGGRERTPPCPGTGLRCAAGLCFPAAARACWGLGHRARSLGAQGIRCLERKRGESSSPRLWKAHRAF
jgi:hypothetical protein